MKKTNSILHGQDEIHTTNQKAREITARPITFSARSTVTVMSGGNTAGEIPSHAVAVPYFAASV
jgi:hypothetical protein